MKTKKIRHAGPITIARCTEALDPRAGFAFTTVADDDGRCIEIAHNTNQMLMSRRLAREVALAILEICGRDDDKERKDCAWIIAHDAPGGPTLEIYEPPAETKRRKRNNNMMWIEQVRSDAGLPPRRSMGPLFDPSKVHG